MGRNSEANHRLIADWSRTTLQARLIKTGARVVGHARAIAFRHGGISAKVTNETGSTGLHNGWPIRPTPEPNPLPRPETALDTGANARSPVPRAQEA
ncbi:hypothetical protein C6Y53_14560 [Pukyongiella litopenaei]|uniref:Uncharacterized protein n=1 Tax=Pukyongiella litopenaei TaxID=2605946 RepID=A0A2S0MSF3_9RHOB|nr:hypothetical protein C6Y53_14560 [Pukyongiella litopenaei]